MQMASGAGIPGWAVAFGLLVILGCCGIVGYRIFSDRTPPPITNEMASNDEPDSQPSDADNDLDESNRKRPGMKRRDDDSVDAADSNSKQIGRAHV